MSGGLILPAQPQTCRTRIFLFTWLLSLHFSFKEEFTRKYGTDSIAFAVLLFFTLRLQCHRGAQDVGWDIILKWRKEIQVDIVDWIRPSDGLCEFLDHF
jgi:hypothetical protein